MIDKLYTKFENREDSLTKMLDIIPSGEFSKPNTILIAISYGGLYLAYEISKRFDLPLDFLFTEPLFAPKNNECEVAIVSESMDIAINDTLVESFGISYDFIYGEAKRRYDEGILPNIYKYRKGETMQSLNKRNVILIDDGVESGLTMSVAIKTCMKKFCSTIRIAVPVISSDTRELLETSVDAIYSFYTPLHFVDTEYYYENFEAVDSALVVEMLNKSLIKGNDNGTKSK